MEQVAAWLDCPWKAIGRCWKMTEAVFGEIVLEVTKVSMKAAQEVESVMTLLKKKNVVRDSHGNIGIGGSLGMHWPARQGKMTEKADCGDVIM
eukprot:4067674-Ditylum_brightwellii.AAC.1